MPTPIEWCDETFNPWWGCEPVGAGSAHCYADTFATRLGMRDLWPSGNQLPIGDRAHGFRFFGDKHWDEPLKWARTLPAKLGRRPRVFCASMADVFEERRELELQQPDERRIGLHYRDHLNHPHTLTAAERDHVPRRHQHREPDLARIPAVSVEDAIPVAHPSAQAGEAAPLAARLHPVSSPVEPLVLADRPRHGAALPALEVHSQNGTTGVYA